MIAQTTDDLVVAQLLPTWADVLAISLGAISGSIVARRWGADILGILLIAIVSGLGGGILRDVLLNRRPVALTNEVLIPAALIASMVGFFFADLTARLHRRLDVVIVVVNALFLGVYAIIGTEKSLLVGLPTSSCVFVGVLAGVGGGLTRDIMLNKEPAVLQPGALNAAAALVGCIAYAVLVRYTDLGPWLGPVCVMLIVALRLASVYFGWRTPTPRDLVTESHTMRVVAERIGLDHILLEIDPQPAQPADPETDAPPEP
ncbi:MAG: TRIC cation channel family protein [Ilumatobacteraceae bacterium]|nr:MAG: TRIC cation channel family protein [Actinomycetota bacterium]